MPGRCTGDIELNNGGKDSPGVTIRQYVRWWKVMWRKQKKQKSRTRSARGYFQWVISENITEKVTFKEQSWRKWGCKSHSIPGKIVSGEKTSKWTLPELRAGWGFLRDSKVSVPVKKWGEGTMKAHMQLQGTFNMPYHGWKRKSWFVWDDFSSFTCDKYPSYLLPWAFSAVPQAQVY